VNKKKLLFFWGARRTKQEVLRLHITMHIPSASSLVWRLPLYLCKQPSQQTSCKRQVYPWDTMVSTKSAAKGRFHISKE
ncbi:hypothetical protein U9M48_021108, partial [Paspalum notatum var. saurae]